MLNSHFSLLLARIARRSRLLVLALMSVGLFLTVVHSEPARAVDPAATTTEILLSDPGAPTGFPVSALVAPTATCPPQPSCHHGQPMVSIVADTADAPTQGNFLRLLPVPVQATGRRASLDHPPPIA